MKSHSKHTANIQLAQSIVAMLLMITGILLVVSGDTYVFALYLVGAGIIFSLYLMISRTKTSKEKKGLGIFAKAAILCWVYIFASYTIIVTMPSSIFGEGFESLSNWAVSSLCVGLIGLVATGIDLFKSSKD